MLTDKIEECYHYYTLCNNVAQVLKYVKVSRATLMRYVRIIEDLDITLFDLLNKKGKGKLTINFAEYFVKNVRNPDHQVEIFKKIETLSDKKKKENLKELTECPICCDNSDSHIQMPCCGIFICVTCLYKYIDQMINNITFGGVRCPCCNIFFNRGFIRRHLLTKVKRYGNSYSLPPSLHWFKVGKGGRPGTIGNLYNRNIYKKMSAIIRKIERMNGKKIGKELDFDTLVSGNDAPQYYGVCKSCCPPVSKNNPVYNFESLKVTTVDKQCVNGEGNLVVLKDEMFKCPTCKGEEDVVFKKCPHCGIRTMKPDGCNYVICGDHRWCFICNERLEISHEGHNVHYWMGRGTGPYSDECRESNNYDAPRYILDKCDCYSCRSHGGLRLCETFECNERCIGKFCTQCSQ